MFLVIGLGLVSLNIFSILSCLSNCSGVGLGITVLSFKNCWKVSSKSFSHSILKSPNEFIFVSDSLLSSFTSLYNLNTIS